MSKLVCISMNLNGSACTDSALSFDHPEGKSSEPLWIPRSQIANLEHVIDEFPDGIGWTTEGMVEIEMPQWLAESKGIESYCEEIDDDD